MQTQLLTQRGAQKVTYLVVNDTASEIESGTLVSFVADGTNPGASVEPLSTAGAAKANTLFAGVVGKTLAANGGQGHIQISGMAQEVRVLSGTRAASTDSYASAAAIAGGDIYSLNTVGNALSRSGAGSASIAGFRAVAIEARASVASAASTTSDSSLNRYTKMKVLLRSL